MINLALQRVGYICLALNEQNNNVSIRRAQWRMYSCRTYAVVTRVVLSIRRFSGVVIDDLITGDCRCLMQSTNGLDIGRKKEVVDETTKVQHNGVFVSKLITAVPL
jgi:hypothetical protein